MLFTFLGHEGFLKRLKMIKYGDMCIEIKSLVFENKIKRERTGFQLLLIKDATQEMNGKTQARKNTCKAYS